MSITINIYYTSENEKALKFAKEMVERGIVNKIREKEGNIKYDYFISLDDPNTLLLIDSWKNQEAIDEHHKSDVMQEIINLQNKYNLKMHVERYKNDNESIPEYDKKFIRD